MMTVFHGKGIFQLKHFMTSHVFTSLNFVLLFQSFDSWKRNQIIRDVRSGITDVSKNSDFYVVLGDSLGLTVEDVEK